MFCNEIRSSRYDKEERYEEWCKNELSAFFAHVIVDTNSMNNTKEEGCRECAKDKEVCNYDRYC